MKILNILCVLVTIQTIHAGRPVFHSLSRTELINNSELIISGWPTVQKTINNCSTSIGSWYVHKVHKGDKKFEGQNIMIADHQHKLIEESQKVGKGVSYASQIYSQNGINKEQSTSFLFLNVDKEGCTELSAVGAQEHRFNEAEIEALLSNDCEIIERGFESKLYKIPKNCKVEEDCRGHYLHPNSCRPPYLGNKEISAILDNDFLTLKNRFISLCGHLWKDQGPCAPQVISMVCKNGLCERGISELKLTSVAKMDSADLSFGCAPHDALSTMIYLKPKTNQFPAFSINWWGDNRVKQAKGIYYLKAENENEVKSWKNFSANYCINSGSCASLKMIDLKIEVIDNDLNGEVTFKLILENNLKIEGKAPMKFKKPQNQVLCG